MLYSLALTITKQGGGEACARRSQSVVRTFVEECINNRRLELIDELFAEDFVDHTAPPQLPAGTAGRKAWLSAVFNAIPDLHSTIEHMIEEDGIVATRVTARGTHQGELMGIPPSGNPVESRAMSFDRVENGKIVEKWEIRDMQAFLQRSPD